MGRIVKWVKGHEDISQGILYYVCVGALVITIIYATDDIVTKSIIGVMVIVGFIAGSWYLSNGLRSIK